MAPQKGEPQEPSTLSTIRPWIVAFSLVLLSAATSCISQLTLAPSFGAIPSSINHKTALISTFALGFCLQQIVSIPNRKNAIFFLGIWIFYIPAIQWYLVPYHETLGIIGGPILQGFLSCHTIIIPSAWILAANLEDLSAHYGLSKRIVSVVSGLLALLSLRVIEERMMIYLIQYLINIPSQTPTHLQVLLATAYILLNGSNNNSKNKLFLLALPAIFHIAALNPHQHTSRLNQILNTHDWTLLDRAWSETGYISVLESRKQDYRIMRADHSLLGGEWTLTPKRAQLHKWKTPEPIYAVFQLLEAVRLMDLSPPPPSRGTKIPDTSASALVIGLGIGTTPSALISHGINTTILDIDSAVHRFATSYFSLPSNHTFIHADATSWVASSSSSQNDRKFDYLIHDVFTGGAEPLPLFTSTFLTHLRGKLTPDGAIALNYAGELGKPLTDLVLRTIYTVFDAQCRTFRDSEPASEGEEGGDFVNLVVFCRNSPGLVTFRKPVEGDYLGSISRRTYLFPKPEKEVAVVGVGGDGEVLRVEDVRKWEKEQAESAKRHWGIMRGLLEPAVVWELW